ncbi:MAG: fibronectin type III domain-containing protein, partial [Kiritimatiellae bacterium]|nr:fibronectin type III domain-containing protein [Kiritimatiellia bacterium]
MKRSTQYGAWAMAFGLAAAKPAWAMSLTQARSYLVDTNATVETTALFWNLKDGMGQRLLFGHQYTTQYGIADGEWTDLPGTQNRSDVKTAVGRFPAVFGTDVSRGLYGSWSYLGNHVRNAYNRKMLVTLSWMMRNPVTGGGHHVSDAERNEPSLTGYPMRELVPGGTGNATYRGWLDQLADFFHNQVKVNDADVPIVFRPFHEHTGGWFWWGEPYCTPEEFKAAWRYTVTYLRDTKSVHNLLFAYSPNGPLTESKILGRYPGDGYVDVIGFDQYSTDLSASARTAVLFAEPRNKVAAITEFGGTAGGLNKLSNGNYYMDFLNAIKSDPYARKVAYALTWGSGSTAAYWVPVQGDAYYNAFVDFYRDPYTAFEGEIGNYYAYPFGVDTQRPAPPSGLTATPVSSSKIALSWADNSTNEDGFKIDRRQSGQTNWLRVATPAANARTYADTGLSPATHYYYKIKATN